MYGFYLIVSPNWEDSKDDYGSQRLHQITRARKLVDEIEQHFGHPDSFVDRLSATWGAIETCHAYYQGHEVVTFEARSDTGELWLMANTPEHAVLLEG